MFSPTLQLGAFATYDALSVSLTALATWVIVQASYRRHRGELVALSAMMLALADVTAYSGIVMIPVVVGFAFVVWLPRMGSKQALFCTAWFTVTCAFVFGVIMTLSKTWQAITVTVLARNSSGISGANGYASPSHVFNDSWTYSGVIAILGLLGAILAISSEKRQQAALVTYLAAVAFVVPLAQAHETTAVSLKKHLAYGAIFAVMAAGYGLRKLTEALRGRRITALACCACAFTFPAVNGYMSAQNWYHTWPNDNSLLARLEPLLKRSPIWTTSLGGADYLCDYYYAGQGNSWERCHTNLTIRTAEQGTPEVIVLGYPASIAPPSRLPTQLLLSPAATQQQFLSFLSRNTAANSAQNPELARLTKILETGHRYRLVATGPYDSNQSTAIYAVWQRVAR